MLAVARLDRAIQYSVTVPAYHESPGILGHPLSRVMTAVCGASVLILQLPFQPRHGDAFARQLIGAFVLVVAGVALDPVPAHLVLMQ